MPQKQRELFVSERPVRSDLSRERSYARRRMVTLAVLALMIGGTAYAFWGRHATNPADIPTIQAEGVYKQKPADPGGIDIPHQDVQVYDELEGKDTPPQQVEHLLPLPETPKDTPHPVAAAIPAPVPEPPAPPPAPAINAEPVIQPPPKAPPPLAKIQKPDAILQMAAPKNIATTVTPVAVATAAPVDITGEKTEPSTPTLDQALKDTHALAASPAPAETPPPPAAPKPSGATAIQLASSNDQAAAQTMLKNLQQKYAAELGGAPLTLVRADLGSKGIFYRIQSQGLSDSAANHICSALKQKHAGCILVRK